MLVLTSPPSPPILHLERLTSSSLTSSSSSSLYSTLSPLRRRSPLICYCSSTSTSTAITAVTAANAATAEDKEDDKSDVNNKFKNLSKIGGGAFKRENPLLLHHQLPHSTTFLNARSGEELLSGIKREVEFGRLPLIVAATMEGLYHYYRNAVLSSEIPYADEVVLSNMGTMLDLILLDMEDPYEFPPHHKAVREPVDYYMFGQSYMRPLVDFDNSYVGNISLFHDIHEKLQKGHNVVLMSNHQTEADPAVIALLLEKTYPHIAENMIYVAGDRVVTDPLCKPFSMGRNLLCVYSKKHMHDDPELVDMKRRANTRSLKEMVKLLREGSQIIWIAPSGGRDRPDPVTHEWYPAPFDVASAVNMRRLVEHAGVPGHIYPLAILCYDIMPPPPQVEKEIGEKRVMSFQGTGISVAPEVNYHDVAIGDEEEAKSAYAQALYDSVCEQYKVLKAAIHGKQGLGASTPSLSLSQPWT